MLRIALRFSAAAGQNSDSDDPPVLKSNVTELVAKRMDLADVSVSWEIEKVDDVDEEEEGDYSEDGFELSEDEDDAEESDGSLDGFVVDEYDHENENDGDHGQQL